MSYLIALFAPIWKWLISFGIEELVKGLKNYTISQAAKEKRDKEIQVILDEYSKDAVDPGLSPLDKAKAEEDAFKKLSHSVNNLP
jgi:hypothetical protein